jgi:hypothetical protein
MTPKKKKRTLHSTNTTGYIGVSKSGERFVAQIAVNKKKTYISTITETILEHACNSLINTSTTTPSLEVPLLNILCKRVGSY